MLVQKLLKTDDAPVKRVELHLHSNMSTMDGMNGSADLAKLAHRWGHRAMAITDHGVCRASRTRCTQARAGRTSA